MKSAKARQFRQGRILIKGNSKTQDKVILRELHMRPGQQYDSSEIQDAEDRLRGLPEFSSVSIIPVGDDPNVRDLLVDVTEQRTAQISAGIGINSNGGFGGQLGYEQQNFDITNFPTSWGEAFSDRAFTGAGQDFTARFDPGTQGRTPPSAFSSRISSTSRTVSAAVFITKRSSGPFTTTTGWAAKSSWAGVSTTFIPGR